MKSLFISFFILLFLLVSTTSALYFFTYRPAILPITISPSPTLTKSTPTITVAPPCTASALAARISFEGAAGNTYGTAVVANISNIPCSIPENTYIDLTFDKNAVENLLLSHNGQPDTDIYTLMPNASVTARIHYPNGPQCSTPVRQISTRYQYLISPGTLITFSDVTNKKDFLVPTCTSLNEITTIDITPFSAIPKN